MVCSHNFLTIKFISGHSQPQEHLPPQLVCAERERGERESAGVLVKGFCEVTVIPISYFIILLQASLIEYI